MKLKFKKNKEVVYEGIGITRKELDDTLKKGSKFLKNISKTNTKSENIKAVYQLLNSKLSTGEIAVIIGKYISALESTHKQFQVLDALTMLKKNLETT